MATNIIHHRAFATWNRKNIFYEFFNSLLEVVSGSVTVNSGITLTIQAGSTIKFASSTSLTINGTLNATSATFTSTSPSTTWSGILFNSGSSGNINGCTISRVYSNDGSKAGITVNNASPTIQNTTIENITGTAKGIRVIELGAPQILSNTIRNTEWHGVDIRKSNPTLRFNNITGSASNFAGAAAVWCIDLANPVLGSTSPAGEGRNTLRDFPIGLEARGSSTVYAGPSDVAYKNRLFGNSTANAYAHETSVIYAMHAWWGQSPPDASKIQAASGSAIYYDPWLTSDPGAAFRLAPDPAPTVLLPTLNVVASSTAETNDRRSLLIRALEHRFAGRSQEAIALYKSLLTDAPHSDEAMFALIELGNVYREVRDNGVLGYIESLSKIANRFRATALQILSNCYRVDGSFAQALVVNSTLVSDFAGTEHEKYGRLNQFFINYNSQRYRQAREQLTTLQARYPDEEMVAIAAWLMEVADGETQPSTSQRQVARQSKPVVEQPISLVAFPNPFNPAIQFEFRVAQAGPVLLRVFDILGRELAVLLNEEKNAGMYRAAWNASTVPSGLYVARLESGGKAVIQKILLVR